MHIQGERVFLYGAGINAFGVVKYLGKENIVAIIEGNREKIGMEIDEIPIVDMEYYQQNNKGEKIVISAFQKSDEIANFLEKLGVDNYLIAPYIQSGFPEIEEIAVYMLKKNMNKLVIGDKNLVSYLLVQYIRSNDIPIEIVGVLERNAIGKTNDLPVLNLDSISDDIYILSVEENVSIADKKNCICVVKDMRASFFDYNENLCQFKDKFKGERCFVIGAGPSLRMEDLDVLAENNEICFASNKIYLAFEKTKWRPDFYMVCDFNVYRSCYDEIRKITEPTVFIENFYNDLELEELPGVYKVNSVHQKNEFRFSEDIEKYVYSGLTVTYNMLQLAVYMGFSEIYLLGIDFSFSGMSEDKGNHFCEEYSKNTKMKGSFYAEESLRAYKAAEDISHKRGIRIYNATRGGKLEVFERKEFDTLFNEEKKE